MHSDLIGKIAKARQYANEPERLSIEHLAATFTGSNNAHQVALDLGRWTCDCAAFRLHTTCAHVMAFQRIVAPSLDAAARAEVPLTMQSDLISMIEKSRHYVHERERIRLHSLRVRFRGSNNDHMITLGNDQWACSCASFRLHHTCAHIMALQRLWATMLSAAALQPSRDAGELETASLLH
jgi:hypothetical protein